VNPQRITEVMDPQQSGPAPKALRFALLAASGLYKAAVRLRNFLYDKALLKTHSVAVPVISVGNITVGGTGKTPLVIWLCNYLTSKGLKPAILTRGYKSRKNCLYDEPGILAKSCPQAKIIVNPDRLTAAARAVNDHAADICIMDDGFQHRRLARDVDIITIDATCPFGYGRLLPAGLLREPPASLSRANAVIITRTAQIPPHHLEELEKKLKLINPNLVIARAVHKPICAKAVKGRQITLQQLKDKKIFAFCGIGNPKAFEQTLRSLNLNLLTTRIYKDHHNYSSSDMTDIYEQARYLNADLILCTQKDWLKTALPEMPDDSILFAYLDIKLELVAQEDKITQLIDSIL